MPSNAPWWMEWWFHDLESEQNAIIAIARKRGFQATNAHAVFSAACEYLGLESRRISHGLEKEIKDLAAQIDYDTRAKKE